MNAFLDAFASIPGHVVTESAFVAEHRSAVVVVSMVVLAVAAIAVVNVRAWRRKGR